MTTYYIERIPQRSLALVRLLKKYTQNRSILTYQGGEVEYWYVHGSFNKHCSFKKKHFLFVISEPMTVTMVYM